LTVIGEGVLRLECYDQPMPRIIDWPTTIAPTHAEYYAPPVPLPPAVLRWMSERP